MTLRAETLAYFAGLVDGEGYVTVYKASASFVAMVAISSTSTAMIDWLQNNIPGGRSQFIREATDKRDAVYRWTLQGRAALLNILPHVIPYAVVKKLQLQLVLKYCEEIAHGNRGEKYSTEERELQEAYYVLLRGMNTVGPTSAEVKSNISAMFAGGEVSLA